MIKSLVSVGNISFILVFLEGILSFFSPCVIPLIPIYMGYLSGNTDDIGADGVISYNRKKVFFHTICFVLGISFAFFILGMSFTAIGSFFQRHQLLFTRIGGIVIIALGLFQVGIFELKFLNHERKFNLDLSKRNANPLVALIMGFTFSFAWTPCVGPALSSVLILASSASSSLVGNFLVLVYAVGFILPFLLLGLFTTQALNFLRNHKKLVKYTVKTGGIILIIMGVMTFTGWMNGISGYLNSFVPDKTLTNNDRNTEEQAEKQQADAHTSSPEDTVKNSAYNFDNNTDDSINNSTNNIKDDSSVSSSEGQDGNTTDSTDDTQEPEVFPAFDFTLIDQYGNEHTLSDYKGKVVFLNFWATWCPPCRAEMPDIEDLYIKYNKNEDDVVFLGVANPWSENNTNTRELDKAGVIDFLEKNGFTFPVVFDETGDVFMQYYVSALPTTFLIDKEGNIYGYAAGMLTKDIMKNAIEQTLNATK